LPQSAFDRDQIAGSDHVWSGTNAHAWSFPLLSSGLSRLLHKQTEPSICQLW